MPKILLDADEFYIEYIQDRSEWNDLGLDPEDFNANAVDISDEEYEAIKLFWRQVSSYRKMMRGISYRVSENNNQKESDGERQ